MLKRKTTSVPKVLPQAINTVAWACAAPPGAGPNPNGARRNSGGDIAALAGFPSILSTRNMKKRERAEGKARLMLDAKKTRDTY